MNHSETVTRLERSHPITWPRYWWLNALCALATLITTTVFGSALVVSFQHGQPLNPDLIWQAYGHLVHGDSSVWNGLEFSAPLLLILLAHELGHYLECVHWQVDATLPYFLPSPTLFGTLGAFIRIKSPIFSRTSLFDIGIAGPLAGFVVLMPFLIAGVALSHVAATAPPAQFVFGLPLAARLFESFFFPHVQAARIVLHPMAMAAWAGLLATAMNLLPVGQLDGGHIIYATLGPRLHRFISTFFVGVLVIAGFWYWPWWFWAVPLFFFGRFHPLVYDRGDLPHNRLVLTVLICVVFLLCFSLVPVRVT